jgi:hypothetical protein
MSTQEHKGQKVEIYNEAGTGLVSGGTTNDNGKTVTELTNPVVEGSTYQLKIGGGQRRGADCLTYDAATRTATFTQN